MQMVPWHFVSHVGLTISDADQDHTPTSPPREKSSYLLKPVVKVGLFIPDFQKYDIRIEIVCADKTLPTVLTSKLVECIRALSHTNNRWSHRQNSFQSAYCIVECYYLGTGSASALLEREGWGKLPGESERVAVGGGTGSAKVHCHGRRTPHAMGKLYSTEYPPWELGTRISEI
ncbi:hypothetical protein ACJJTC_019617 [Scirpophaga incertulas]